MRLVKYMMNNEEKKEILDARQKYKELDAFYNDAYNKANEAYILMIKTIDEQKEKLQKIFDIIDKDSPIFEEMALDIAEDCIENFVHAYFKALSIKTTKTVGNCFIRILKAMFFVGYKDSYINKMREILKN